MWNRGTPAGRSSSRSDRPSGACFAWEMYAATSSEGGARGAAVAVFPTGFAVRASADMTHTIVRRTELDRGGHFPALEAPGLLVEDLRE